MLNLRNVDSMYVPVQTVATQPEESSLLEKIAKGAGGSGWQGGSVFWAARMAICTKTFQRHTYPSHITGGEAANVL